MKLGEALTSGPRMAGFMEPSLHFLQEMLLLQSWGAVEGAGVPQTPWVVLIVMTVTNAGSLGPGARCPTHLSLHMAADTTGGALGGTQAGPRSCGGSLAGVAGWRGKRGPQWGCQCVPQSAEGQH